MSTGLAWIFLLSALFCYGASAFSVISPAANSRIGLHAMFRVAWTSDPLVTSITIQLAEGPSSAALQITGTLAQDISAVTGYAVVTAPSTTKPGSDYYLRIQGNSGMVATTGPITFFQDVATASSSGITQLTSSFSNILPIFSFPTIRPSSPAISASSSSSLATSQSLSSSSVTQSSSSSSFSSSNSNPSSPHESVQGSQVPGSSSTLSSPEMAGIAIGSVAAAALVFAGFLFMRKRSRDDEHDGQTDAISEIVASPHLQEQPMKAMNNMNSSNFNGGGSGGSGGQFYSTGYEPYPPSATYDNRMPSPTLPTQQPHFYHMGSYTHALAPVPPPQQQEYMMPEQPYPNYYPAYWGGQQEYNAYQPEAYYGSHGYHASPTTPQSPHQR